MKIINPVTVTDAVLVASNVPDTLPPYSATRYYYVGEHIRDVTDHNEYEALVGDVPVSVTITNAIPGVVTHTAHGLTANTPVVLTTSGTLPTGLAEGVTYYVRNPATDTYELSATSGGASIDTTGTQDGSHTARTNPNIGNLPSANPAVWLLIGSENRWAMFDAYIESQTSNAESIEATLVPPLRADALALFNVFGSSIDVEVTDAIDGVIYDESFPLLSNANVSDYFDYCFEPIIRRTSLMVEGLPRYVGPEIKVTINAPSGTAQCGSLAFGSLRKLGATVYGAGFGIIDHSRKQTDDFGRTSLVPRSYRKTGTFKVVVEKDLVDEVGRLLSERRAVLSVFSGTDDYSSTLIYGFPKDWSASIDYPLHSYLSIEIEGVA